MSPRVIGVQPEQNFKLLITFNNGEIKSFDVRPYLEIGIFKELQDVSLFNSVKPFLGSIQWANGLDLVRTLFILKVKLINCYKAPPPLQVVCNLALAAVRSFFNNGLWKTRLCLAN